MAQQAVAPSPDARTRVSTKIRATGSDCPSAMAIEFKDQRLSWGCLRRFYDELEELIDATCSDRTASPRIVLAMANRPTSVAAAFGLLGYGRPFTVMSTIQPEAALIKSVVASRPDIVIADEIHWSPMLVTAVEGMQATAISLRSGDDVVAALRVHAGAGVSSRPHSPEDGAVTVTTSGTTGAPKLVTLGWRALPISRKPPHAVVDDGKPRPVTLHPLALSTVGGLMNLLLAVERGRPIVLMERFDVRGWSELVAKHRPRRAGLPPAAMRSLLDASIPREMLSSIKEWPTGSARLPAELKAEFEAAYDIPVLEYYGATEFGGEVAGWTLDLHREWSATKGSSVGRAVLGNQLRVVDPASGDEVEPGVQGLLEVKPRRAPAGTDGGWVRTNDLARLDEDGFLYVDGRADDVIVRGGFKVPLHEVEQTLRQHPAVSDVAAIGLDHDRLGQVPAAAVVLKPDADSTVDSAVLVSHVRELLAPYKVPTKIVVLDHLPRTDTMKVSRPALRQILDAAVGSNE